MSMMAKTNAALARLFQRLDSLPRPSDQQLSDVFQEWLDRRRQLIAPTPEALIAPGSTAAARAFTFRRDAATPQDYVLTSDPAPAAALIGELPAGGRLAAAKNRRGAVRLRRLFDMVGRTGEPILAVFSTRYRHAPSVYVELLVAPLSSDGRTIDSFLASASMRRLSSAATKVFPNRVPPNVLLFALQGSGSFGERVASELGLPLSQVEERIFEDGEEKTRPLVEVRGRDVCVVSGLARSGDQSVHDRLCKLLFFIATLKTNGASRVTVAAPYLAYMRKDRQTKLRDPLTAAYVARLFEAVGTDCLLTMDTHNLAAFQNAFRCLNVHLTAYEAFASHFANLAGSAEVTVVSPDLGGAKRAEMFREALEKLLHRPVGMAFMEKQRSQGIVSGDLFAGEVRGRTAVIIDDIISSGTTMARAAQACADRGAAHIHLCASHALFSSDAAANLAAPFIDEILVSDTVEVAAPYRDDKRLTIMPVAGLFAGAIARFYEAEAR